MIDSSMFTIDRLVKAFLDDSHGNVDMWRKHATIIPQYMPPFPGKDTKPTCVVAWEKDHEVYRSFLRYSRGPSQGHLWDVYGDDYITPELAFIALLQAPIPPSLQPGWLWDENRKTL